MIPIFSPLRCAVAAFTSAMVFSRSNSVLPQPGQEIYSVLYIRIRAACRISFANCSNCAAVKCGFSSTNSVHPSSHSTRPHSAAACNCISPQSACEDAYTTVLPSTFSRTLSS